LGYKSGDPEVSASECYPDLDFLVTPTTHKEASMPTTPLKVSSISPYRLSPLTIGLLWRLSVCMASTFGFGSFLALYAMPRILRECADGDPKGFAAFILVSLWVQSLADMWQHVRRNLLQLWENRRAQKPLSIEIHEQTEGSAQI
jgi:hypothetical protein